MKCSDILDAADTNGEREEAGGWAPYFFHIPACYPVQMGDFGTAHDLSNRAEHVDTRAPCQRANL